MAEEFTHDVFLSHSKKDATVVRDIAERLRTDGLRVWLDEWEIHPGDSIPAKIEEGLEHSRVLVLCMSAQAFGSDWSTLERKAPGAVLLRQLAPAGAPAGVCQTPGNLPPAQPPSGKPDMRLPA